MITCDKTYTYDEIFQKLQQLAECYTDFTVCRTIGSSHDERPIPMLRLGLGMKTLVLTGGICGNERTPPVLLIKLLEEYCDAYQEDRELDGYPIRKLLNACALAVIPLLNPDGYQIAGEGFTSIRNPVLRQLCRIRRIPQEEWTANARGILINGNFPCHSYTCQQLGEYPASEQETLALIHVFQEYDTLGYLDFHSRENVLYYYNQSMPFTYNFRNHHLARYLRKVSSYTLGKKTQGFSGGSPVNYYSEFLGMPALTVETLEDPGITVEKKYQEVRCLPLEYLSRM